MSSTIDEVTCGDELWHRSRIYQESFSRFLDIEWDRKIGSLGTLQFSLLRTLLIFLAIGFFNFEEFPSECQTMAACSHMSKKVFVKHLVHLHSPSVVIFWIISNFQHHLTWKHTTSSSDAISSNESESAPVDFCHLRDEVSPPPCKFCIHVILAFHFLGMLLEWGMRLISRQSLGTKSHFGNYIFSYQIYVNLRVNPENQIHFKQPQGPHFLKSLCDLFLTRFKS